jgi:hypothetical protein
MPEVWYRVTATLFACAPNSNPNNIATTKQNLDPAEYACSAAAEISGLLVVLTMQSCNAYGRQAVMSALVALVLAGKGLNAFSVLLRFN